MNVSFVRRLVSRLSEVASFELGGYREGRVSVWQILSASSRQYLLGVAPFGDSVELIVSVLCAGLVGIEPTKPAGWSISPLLTV